VLVELGVVEQRYDAVKEVLDEGGAVTEVAERYGVTRQSLHNWLSRYRERGMAGLVDRSKRPRSCPHRTPARAEIRVIELRREHPRWGPRRLAYELARKGADARRLARASTGSWCAQGSSSRRPGVAGARTTCGGSGPARWSCGSSTSWRPGFQAAPR
jgi:transposase-like protein